MKFFSTALIISLLPFKAKAQNPSYLIGDETLKVEIIFYLLAITGATIMAATLIYLLIDYIRMERQMIVHVLENQNIEIDNAPEENGYDADNEASSEDEDAENESLSDDNNIYDINIPAPRNANLAF